MGGWLGEALDERGKERILLTEEGAGGKEGDDEGLATRGEMEAKRVSGKVCGTNTKGAQPVVHLDDTGDGTGVVTEEDTTKGGKGSHGNACHPALGAGGTNAPACSNWTTRHDARRVE